MIFLLTFNLVAVSGIRGETVVQLARARLSTIGIGFGVCVFTSLCMHPMWASDELHNSVASRFEALACSIDGNKSSHLSSIPPLWDFKENKWK